MHIKDGQYKSCEEIFAEYENDDEETNGSSSGSGPGGSKSGKGSAKSKKVFIILLARNKSLSICVSGQSGSSNSAEDAIDNLKAKLESGESLTEDEVTQMREYIDSLRGTAEFLLQTAAELEAKLL